MLRTPQYHPELQPIEHVWGIVKSHIADGQQGDYTLSNLESRLEPAFPTVTQAVCKDVFAHVRKEEDRYWKVDEELDQLDDAQSTCND